MSDDEQKTIAISKEEYMKAVIATTAMLSEQLLAAKIAAAETMLPPYFFKHVLALAICDVYGDKKDVIEIMRSLPGAHDTIRKMKIRRNQ